MGMRLHGSLVPWDQLNCPDYWGGRDFSEWPEYRGAWPDIIISLGSFLERVH